VTRPSGAISRYSSNRLKGDGEEVAGMVDGVKGKVLRPDSY
jgi:hypothetical protein